MKPQRIVSLTPSNTEILFALGVGGRVAGVTEFCDYPPETKKIAKIGDSKTRVEAVVALKPDLVVAHTFLNAQAIQALKRLKLNVLHGDAKTIGELRQFIKKVATAVGASAQAIDQQFEASIASVKRNRPKTPPACLFALGADPIWAAAKDCYAHELIELAGGRNVLAKTAGQFVSVNMERIVSAKPQVILTTTGGAKSIRGDRRWRNVPAVVNRRVHAVDADVFTRAGPRIALALSLASRIISRG